MPSFIFIEYIAHMLGRYSTLHSMTYYTTHDIAWIIGRHMAFMAIRKCNNGKNGPEYSHLDSKFEDSVDIKPGGTWKSIHRKRNLSRRLIIAITVCDHYDTTVTDSKGHEQATNS